MERKMTEQQSTEKPSTKGSPQKKKTIWKKIICGISLFVLAFFIVLIGALSTGSGQRELIRLADKWLESFSVEQVTGDLQQGLILNNLQYQSSGVQSTVSQVRLQLDLHCLWQRQLCVRDIYLVQPYVQIDTALLPPQDPQPKDNGNMEKIHLPIEIQLDRFKLQDLAIQIDQHTIQLANFQTALSLNNKRGFTLYPTLIEGLQIHLEQDSAEQKIVAQEQNKDKNEYKETAMPVKKERVDWEKLEQDLTPGLLAHLDKIELPFDFHINQLEGKNWQLLKADQASPLLHIFDFLVQLDSQNQHATLHRFQVNSNLGRVQGAGHIQLEQDFPLDLKLDATMLPLKTAQLNLPQSQLNLQLSGKLKQQTALNLQTQGALNAQLQATSYFNQPKTPFNIQLKAQDVSYPLSAEVKDPLQLKQFSTELSGDLLDYQLHLTTQLQGLGLPASKIDLQAKGKLPEIEIEKLQLDTLQGQALMQGKVGWYDGLQWYQQLHLNNLVFTDYLSKLPMKLSGELFTTGLLNDEQWLIDIPDLNIQGKLSKKPLNLKGQLSFGSDKHWDQLLVKVPVLDLNYGENQIQAKGRIGEESDFKLQINAPNLAGILRHLKGKIQGSMSLQGKLEQPAITVNLTGQGLQYQELTLHKLGVNGNVDVAQQSQGQLKIQLNGLTQGGLNIKQANLSLSGNEPQHQLQFQLQGTPIGAKWQLNGSFDRTSQQWKGDLSQVQLQSPVGTLQPNQKIAMGYSHQQQQGEISAHCWQNPNLSLCFDKVLEVGKNGNIAFNIKKLNLDLVNQLLNQDLLKGHMQTDGQVVWSGDKVSQAKLNLSGENLALTHKIDYRTFKLSIPKLQLNGDLQNNQLALKSELRLANQGKLLAQLDLKDLAKTSNLSGSLQLQQLNLNLLNQLLSANEHVKGEINGNLKIGGQISSPKISGELHLDNLNAVMKDLPFDITQGQLALNFKGNQSSLQGYLQTPESRLNIDGNAGWQNLQKWHSRLLLQAENFKVDIPNMAKLKLSPNVEINASPTRLELNGEVHIPWARVEIESLPESAVSVSKDEVILDGKSERKLLKKLPSKTKSGMEILSNLNIKVGDDVRLNAYGLKTRLSGLLNVKQDKGTLGLYGQIHLNKGQYASFGQDLLIRKGIISFSGAPSQPMLNIEAIRNPESMEKAGIVAGIKVSGLPDRPHIIVFSEPGMAQDQALSYVLTGRPLERSGESGSGGSIGAALLGLSLAKMGKLVGGIGEAFGIKDLNLGTQGVGDNSKVVVSGNITPRLQVKYGVGLFDGLAELTVRYRLLPQLYVQSVSSVTQAVDLLYQFEF